MKNFFFGVFMTLAIVFGGYIVYNEYRAYFQPRIMPVPMIPHPGGGNDFPLLPRDRVT